MFSRCYLVQIEVSSCFTCVGHVSGYIQRLLQLLYLVEKVETFRQNVINAAIPANVQRSSYTLVSSQRRIEQTC